MVVDPRGVEPDPTVQKQPDPTIEKEKQVRIWIATLPVIMLELNLSYSIQYRNKKDNIIIL